MGIYNKEELIAAIEHGQSFDYLFFYGHTAAADGSLKASCCSQWFPAKFEIDGIEYKTAEHYMMAEKARLFNDPTTLNAILHCQTPAEAKQLGREVRNFDRKFWAPKCIDIVVKGNLAKFKQNDGFSDWLKATEPKVIVEASPSDKIWGIGMGESDPDSKNPGLWPGKNLLGFALMRVRESL
ncbi:NADAR domain-containing protein [soil metagenome]